MPEDEKTLSLKVNWGRGVLRLTSCLPQSLREGRPVRLMSTELPVQVGMTCLLRELRLLCVSPGEWLLSSPTTSGTEIRDTIAKDCKSQHVEYADVSAGHAVIEVTGVSAREVLSKGCGIDLHPRVLFAGRCVRTRFAQVPVVIDCVQDPDRFELYTGRSYTHYLKDWLFDAGVGYAARQ